MDPTWTPTITPITKPAYYPPDNARSIPAQIGTSSPLPPLLQPKWVELPNEPAVTAAGLEGVATPATEAPPEAPAGSVPIE